MTLEQQQQRQQKKKIKDKLEERSPLLRESLVTLNYVNLIKMRAREKKTLKITNFN